MLLPVTEASICTLVLCGRALNSSNVSLQAKANGLLLSPIPPECSNLNSLELRLHGICKVISLRLHYDLVNSNPYIAQQSSKFKLTLCAQSFHEGFTLQFSSLTLGAHAQRRLQ